jgi:hypothetical protein
MLSVIMVLWGQDGMSYEICGNCGDPCWGNNSDLNYFKVSCYQWFFLNKFCNFLPKKIAILM